MAANKLLKVVFVIFQAFFILLGVGLIACGSWLETQNVRFRGLITSRELLYGPYIIIASGCAIFLVSLVGIVGACCETKINKFLLAFYIILVALVFIAQVSGGILAFVYRNESVNIIQNTLNTTFYLYGVNTTEGLDKTSDWDKIQRGFRCCGIRSPQDWVNNPNRSFLLYDFYPRSCCKNETDQICGNLVGVSTNNFFERGCQDVLIDFVNYILLVVAVIGVVFLIGEVLVIAMAIFLVCASDFDD